MSVIINRIEYRDNPVALVYLQLVYIELKLSQQFLVLFMNAKATALKQILIKQAKDARIANPMFVPFWNWRKIIC